MDTSPSLFMLIFTVLGSLGLLIFGMKSMSEALQKMAGPQLRHILGVFNPGIAICRLSRLSCQCQVPACRHRLCGLGPAGRRTLLSCRA